MLFENSVLIYLAIVATSYFFWNCCRKVFFIRRLNGLSGPKTLPFIGNSHILLSREAFMDILFKMADDYSSPFQFWLGSKLFIGIYEPDDAKTILHSKNCINKSTTYKIIPLFGKGLVTGPESIWTRTKVTVPTFSSHMLQNFFTIFVEQSLILTHILEEEDRGNEIILLEHISNCSWRIACDSMMGVKLEPTKSNEHVKAVQRLKDILLYRVKNILLLSDVIFNLTALGHKQKEDTNLMHSFVDEMIQQRIHELNNSNKTRNENNQTHRTFFDILIEASREENFTREEIHDNVMTMLLAASDTISIVTNFAVFMLANFPEMQEKVHDELREIYGLEAGPIKYKDLQNMHYLEQVIKETMRIFPPVPLIGRQVTKNLKIGEVTIPKGTDIIIGIIKMHRNEKYWPNPLTFDPDRFLSKKTKSQSNYYIPFSDGSRNCIGMKYGMMSMKVIIATLVRTFVFKVNESIEIDEIKLKYNLTLSTEMPLKVKIEKRYFQ